MTETPYSTLLRRAAALVREIREDATPGPWQWQTFRCTAVDGGPHPVNCPGVDELIHETGPVSGWPVHPMNVLKAPHGSWPPGYADNRWIAMMSPAIGAELVVLFDMAAVDDENHNPSGRTPSAFTDCAVMLARAVLGEKR